MHPKTTKIGKKEDYLEDLLQEIKPTRLTSPPFSKNNHNSNKLSRNPYPSTTLNSTNATPLKNNSSTMTKMSKSSKIHSQPKTSNSMIHPTNTPSQSKEDKAWESYPSAETTKTINHKEPQSTTSNNQTKRKNINPSSVPTETSTKNKWYKSNSKEPWSYQKPVSHKYQPEQVQFLVKIYKKSKNNSNSHRQFAQNSK